MCLLLCYYPLPYREQGVSVGSCFIILLPKVQGVSVSIASLGLQQPHTWMDTCARGRALSTMEMPGNPEKSPAHPTPACGHGGGVQGKVEGGVVGGGGGSWPLRGLEGHDKRQPEQEQRRSICREQHGAPLGDTGVPQVKGLKGQLGRNAEV